MNIFIYSDESGVFDRIHNDFFVFGGVVLLSKELKDITSRKYSNVEKTIIESEGLPHNAEPKASAVSNKAKYKMYRSLGQVQKFGVVIAEKELLDEIFIHKKTRQRYMDFAYKIAVKRKLETMIKAGLLSPLDVEHIYIFADQHLTATDGRYELQEALEQELKIGTFNQHYSKFFPPLFPNLKDVVLKYCDSKTVVLVRAADIVANRIYHAAVGGTAEKLRNENTNIIFLPGENK